MKRPAGANSEPSKPPKRTRWEETCGKMERWRSMSVRHWRKMVVAAPAMQSVAEVSFIPHGSRLVGGVVACGERRASAFESVHIDATLRGFRRCTITPRCPGHRLEVHVVPCSVRSGGSSGSSGSSWCGIGGNWTAQIVPQASTSTQDTVCKE